MFKVKICTYLGTMAFCKEFPLVGKPLEMGHKGGGRRCDQVL